MANCRRYQQHRWQICHRYQRHRQQILPPVSLVLLTPVANLPPVTTTPVLPPVSLVLLTLVANLPPVSLTPVANNGNTIRLQTLESELEGKNLYICFLYYPKVTRQNFIKIFLIKDFFHLPPVSLTLVANLELRISPRIFEKIRNGLNGILWGWGKTDSWKEPEAKNLVTLSL